MNALEGALSMVDMGFKVFPVKAGKKTPAVIGWQKWAIDSNMETVTTYAKNNPFCNWGVSCEPSHLTVIDVDVKDGREGIDGINAKAIEYAELMNTFLVSTPSGGFHFYLRGDAGTTAKALGKGIDTRGIGGYVVAVGSVVKGNQYTIAKNNEVQLLPEGLKNLINQSKKEKLVTLEDSQDLSGDRNNTLTSLAGTMRSRGMGYEAILAALIQVNSNQFDVPLHQEEVTIIASSVARYRPEDALAATDFLKVTLGQAIIASDIDFDDIPKRDWIMAGRYIGGFVSAIVAAGGAGKSSLTMLDAIAIATGKPLTGFEVKSPGPVWIYNTEDDLNELKRRISAIALYHNITKPELKRIHLTSGKDNPLKLAKINERRGVSVNEKAIADMSGYIKEHGIRLLLLDPFVRAHEVNENDNMQIDKVVWCLQKIIENTGCAVGVVHHTRKASQLNSSAGNMDSARGASALVNSARIAHTLSIMSIKETEVFGIHERRRHWYIRLDSAKANLSSPSEHAIWYEKKSVAILNGDDVGTVEAASLKDVKSENRLMALKSDITAISALLSSMMSEGDELSVSIVMKEVADLGLSEKRGKEKFIEVLESGQCCYEDKLFSHEHRVGKRPSHIIKCDKHEFLE